MNGGYLIWRSNDKGPKKARTSIPRSRGGIDALACPKCRALHVLENRRIPKDLRGPDPTHCRECGAALDEGAAA